MKRLLKLCLASLGLALVAAGPGSAAQFDATGKYEMVNPPQPTEVKGGIEVVEVFWYGCPHCFTLLPMMEHYQAQQPDDVVVRHMPAVFRKSWEVHARAYYTAKILGIDERIHRPFFEAIHNKKQRLATREELAAFFGQYGIDRADFEKTYDSFGVESMVRKSIVMQQRYGVRGTPTLIVNGKYRVSASLAGSYENVFKVLAALVDKERKAAQASQ